jgi:hypothetical protein
LTRSSIRETIEVLDGGHRMQLMTTRRAVRGDAFQHEANMPHSKGLVRVREPRDKHLPKKVVRLAISLAEPSNLSKSSPRANGRSILWSLF